MKKLERGGTVVGASHDDGGVKFVIEDTGRVVEEEGREVNVPTEITDDPKEYTFTGTNRQVLNKILRKGNLSVSDKVTSVRSGDIVICIVSAEDKEKRTYKGTIKQILSAINESGGCKHIESGAQVQTHAKQGGKIASTFISYYSQQGALFIGTYF